MNGNKYDQDKKSGQLVESHILTCTCELFTDKYRSDSGYWYCEECGGITKERDERVADAIAINRYLIGPLVIQCPKCEHIEFRPRTPANSRINTFDDMLLHKSIRCMRCMCLIKITDEDKGIIHQYKS